MTSNNIISADTTIFDDLTIKEVRILLYCDTIVEPSCQHFGNAVNVKVGIPITM